MKYKKLCKALKAITEECMKHKDEPRHKCKECPLGDDNECCRLAVSPFLWKTDEPKVICRVR